jgi:hypothetical protein
VDAHWQKEPEAHDFPAAGAYLSLVFTPKEAAALVDALRSAETVARKAKDLLRASQLALLASDDPYVAHDVEKVRDGKKLSPVLLVRGDARKNIPLTIADGYHRICASYHLDPDEEVVCRIVDLP